MSRGGLRWIRSERRREEDRRRSSDARVDYRARGCESVDGSGVGSDEEGIVAGKAARIACWEGARSKMRKTGEDASREVGKWGVDSWKSWTLWVGSRSSSDDVWKTVVGSPPEADEGGRGGISSHARGADTVGLSGGVSKFQEVPSASIAR